MYAWKDIRISGYNLIKSLKTYFENTLPILAHVEIRSTVYLATRGRFIGPVITVRGTVAMPSLRDTYTGRLALELFLVVALVWRN